MDLLFFFVLIFIKLSNIKGEERMNILFLVADDMRPNLGAYEDANHPLFSSPPMYTPNLDALAAKSLLFERAYTQQALCNPSRTSLLTSRRPDTTRITALGPCWRVVGGNFTTIPQYFKENGYMTVGGGKIFHTGPGGNDNDPPSWSQPFHLEIPDPNPFTHSWKSFTTEELQDYPLVDTREANFIISKMNELAENSSQPFFLAFGVQKPHLPFYSPEEFLQYYPEEDADLPYNINCPIEMPDLAWRKPAVLSYEDCQPDAIGVPNYGKINVTLPLSKIKEIRRGYYASLSHADHELGRVLNELEQLNLLNKTIIVFWGDHGMHLGEQAFWGKKTNFGLATRAPLMIHVPGVTDNGMRTKKKVEFVDLFPTLAELAGLDPIPLCPEYSNDIELCTEGTSMLPLFLKPETEDWKDAIFWQYPRGPVVDDIPTMMAYSIYTDEYSYTEFVSIKRLEGYAYEPDWEKAVDHPELYLLKSDIQENFNVYRDTEYAPIIEDMSERLHAGWRGAIHKRMNE